jgi:hypothetical protein
VILDPGDLTEGFENTAQQSHTNDLSFPDQLDLAHVILTEIVTSVAGRHGSTRVATVPSNHGAWRKGKDRLGTPGDDFGILTHRTVARALAYRDDITFVIPDAVGGVPGAQGPRRRLGLVHGHQASGPTAIPATGGASRRTAGCHSRQPRSRSRATTTTCASSRPVRSTVARAGGSRRRRSTTARAGGPTVRAADTEAGLLTFTIDDAGRWDGLRLLTA